MSDANEKKPCSHCPKCGKALSKTFYTTSGLVFCGGDCRDSYYEKLAEESRRTPERA